MTDKDMEVIDEIEFGEFNWILTEDEDGKVWISPSINWEEDIVAGAMHDGQLLYNLINESIDERIEDKYQNSMKLWRNDN